MSGAELLGQTVVFHPSGDPPGYWAFTLREEVVAELGWSRDERAVRIETPDGVWRARFAGFPVLRGVVEDPGAEPMVLYAGGVRGGLARSRRGRGYALFSTRDRRHGQWTGIDDAQGEGVLRATGRVGAGGFWSEVGVTPEARYVEDVWPLLYLWGGIQLLRRRRPWHGMFAMRASRGAAERALAQMLESLASSEC